jgi:iron complex transport system substrate-binding protein
MKKVLFLLTCIGLVSGLVACQSREDNTNPMDREDVSLTFSVTSGALQNEAQTSWTGGTRTEVTKTFKTNPATVAIFAYDALDMLDSVGLENTSILSLGIPKSNVPAYLNQYQTNSVLNVGTLFIPDWDALELFMPDLIIIGGRSAGAYDQLSSLYPYADILDVTAVNGEYVESMNRNATNLAKIFPTVAEDIHAKMDAIEVSMGAIKNIAKNHEALFIMVNGEALSFYGPNGRFASLYDEFGFIPADPAAEEGGSHGNVIGYEYVASVNPEILFLLDRGVATGGSSTINQVKANALIASTDAGKNNMIFTLDPIAWYISVGGFQSTEQMIDDLMVVMNRL